MRKSSFFSWVVAAAIIFGCGLGYCAPQMPEVKVTAEDKGTFYLITAPTSLNPKYPTQVKLVSNFNTDHLLALQLTLVEDTKKVVKDGKEGTSVKGAVKFVIFPEPIDRKSIKSYEKKGKLVVSVSKSQLPKERLDLFKSKFKSQLAELEIIKGKELFNSMYVIPTKS